MPQYLHCIYGGMFNGKILGARNKRKEKYGVASGQAVNISAIGYTEYLL